MKHTPGPWFANGDRVLFNVDEPGLDDVECVVVQVDAEHPYQDTEADARLIAAAPQLLAFVVALAQEQEGTGNSLELRCNALLARIEGDQ